MAHSSVGRTTFARMQRDMFVTSGDQAEKHLYICNF